MNNNRRYNILIYHEENIIFNSIIHICRSFIRTSDECFASNGLCGKEDTLHEVGVGYI